VPVSGIVITFSSDVIDHGETIKQLLAEPVIEIGESSGAKLAIVIDTDSPRRDREIWDWVQNLPGVAWLDVTFVGFDDIEDRKEPRPSTVK
jgi:nitrate reductase NapAB chaperone NapD